MAVFFIVSDAPQPSVERALNIHYPNKFSAWSDRAWALETDDDAKSISKKIGVRLRKDDGSFDNGVTGTIVTKLGTNYFGFGNSSFWDWLKEAHQRQT